MRRPLLLIDVDGVLCPYGADCPDGYRLVERGIPLYVSERNGRWLRHLAQSFDLTWATMWHEQANVVIGPLHGLGPLPVIQFDRDAPMAGLTFKLEAVRRFVGDRPFVWIDDDLYLDAYLWALRREAPALLVRTDAFEGLTAPMVSAAERFAEAIREGRPADARMKPPSRRTPRPRMRSDIRGGYGRGQDVS
jgi:hypothetical protein